MNTINDREERISFLMILGKPGPFYTIRFEVSNDNNTYFISNDIIIPKPTLETLIDHIRNSGTAIDNIMRFDLKDQLNSYLIIFDASRQLIVRTNNIVTGKTEEFHIKNIDRNLLVSAIESQLKTIG